MDSLSNSQLPNGKTQVLNDLDACHGSKLPPKRRTRFTYSSATDSPPLSDSSSTKLSNISVSKSRSAEHVYLPSLSSLQRRRAFHNSMEDIHRPKNHRERINQERFEGPLTARDIELYGDVEDCDKKSTGTDDSYHSIEESISERDENESGDDYSNTSNRKNDFGQATGLKVQDINTSDKALLLEENILLKNDIEDERKKVLKRKVACKFAFEAMRLQKGHVLEMEAQLQKKKEEVAARIILHHLLLNSWRGKSGELSSVMHENSQLHKTIDNLCLQLRVVRHLQTTEKEKSVQRNKEFEVSIVELRDIRLENKKTRVELDKVSNERNVLISEVEDLKRINEKVTAEFQAVSEKKDSMVKGSELNKIKADKFQRENQNLTKEVTEMSSQVKSLTKQSSHWQEKARAFESECWELKLQIDTKDRTVSDLQRDKKDLVKEHEMLALSKSKTEQLLKQSKDELDKHVVEKMNLQTQFQDCQRQLIEVGGQVGHLDVSLNRLKKENKDLRNNLYDYSLKNVRKRRAWGRALYFIFNPIGVFRNYYFGEEPRRKLGSGGPDCGSSDQFHIRVFNADE